MLLVLKDYKNSITIGSGCQLRVKSGVIWGHILCFRASFSGRLGGRFLNGRYPAALYPRFSAVCEVWKLTRVRQKNGESAALAYRTFDGDTAVLPFHDESGNG